MRTPVSVKLPANAVQALATCASVPSSVTSTPLRLVSSPSVQRASAGVGNVDSLRAGEARQAAQIERAPVSGIEPQRACCVMSVSAETSSSYRRRRA